MRLMSPFCRVPKLLQKVGSEAKTTTHKNSVLGYTDLGIYGYSYIYIRISEYPGIRMAAYLDIQISSYPDKTDIWLSCCPGFPDLHLSESPDTRIYKYPYYPDILDIRVSGDTGNENIRISGCPDIRKYIRTSRISRY
jgi:hypothetical protein